VHRRTFLLATTASAFAGRRLWAKAVSPGTITYADYGGLWVRDLPDGEPRNQVNGAISFPRFSPSGKWIPYKQGEIAWVVSADEKQVRRISKADVAWSPNYDELWVRPEDTDGLSLFSPRNDWNVPIARIADAELGVFSPDGSEMIYIDGGPSADDDDTSRTRILRVPLKDGAESAVIQTTNEDWRLVSGRATCILETEVILSLGGLRRRSTVPCSGRGGEPRTLSVTALLGPDFIQLSPARNELAVADGKGRLEWSQAHCGSGPR
jgi:hypothetical protein